MTNARTHDRNARPHRGKATRFIETRMDLGRDGGFPVVGGDFDVVLP